MKEFSQKYISFDLYGDVKSTSFKPIYLQS
jgi:hypothetical protein